MSTTHDLVSDFLDAYLPIGSDRAAAYYALRTLLAMTAKGSDVALELTDALNKRVDAGLDARDRGEWIK